MSPAAKAFPLRSWVERSWQGEGSVAAALLLRPLSALYAIGSAISRSRRARTRRRLPGMTVLAIGGLTVGGAGKTTLARWAARAALEKGRKPAILLRGHGASSEEPRPSLVPIDAPRNSAASRAYGDEAVAHRSSLPASVAIVVGKDRWKSARLALDSGSDFAILDDGWEQGTLAWDRLWVAIDPRRPLGNGLLLPAGPLRRPPSTLRAANEIVAILEAEEELSGAETRRPGGGVVAQAGDPPDRQPIRFRRIVDGWHRLADAGVPVSGSAPLRGPVLLVSSVGSPERLERFLRPLVSGTLVHLAFPDHTAWDRSSVEASLTALRGESGAPPVIVATDKDAARAALLPHFGAEVWIVRSGLHPVDDPSPLLATLSIPPAGAPVAARPPIG